MNVVKLYLGIRSVFVDVYLNGPVTKIVIWIASPRENLGVIAIHSRARHGLVCIKGSQGCAVAASC